MIFTAAQLVAHFVGDYLLQNTWMATRKTGSSVAALVHALVYILPFLFITRSLAALAVMVATHFAIDRWRLARYVVWARNWLAPRWRVLHTSHCFQEFNIEMRPHLTDEGEKNLMVAIKTTPLVTTVIRTHPWSQCCDTGFEPEIPAFLAIWLLIITDNIIHVGINALAIYLFG
jgi:hypothetical protein